MKNWQKAVTIIFFSSIFYHLFIDRIPEYSIGKGGKVIKGSIRKITDELLAPRTVSIHYKYVVNGQEHEGMETFNNFVLKNLPKIGDSCKVLYYEKDPTYSKIPRDPLW
jgi:hypothetical protein